MLKYVRALEKIATLVRRDFTEWISNGLPQLMYVLNRFQLILYVRSLQLVMILRYYHIKFIQPCPSATKRQSLYITATYLGYWYYVMDSVH